MKELLMNIRKLASSSAKEEGRERDLVSFVKLSSSGQLSVSLKDVVKTQSYKNDLQALKRIAKSHSEGAQRA